MKRQSASKKKIIIGVTGSFGSGKSFVSGIFKSCGAKVIDADKLAHEVIRPGTAAYKKIIRLFGREILKKDRTVNRPKLACIVFANKGLLKKLNLAVHPEVIRRIKREIKASGAKMIILDVPLLIESGLNKLADKVIVVKIKRDKQLERLQKKYPLHKSEILKRIKCQIPLPLKLRLADFIIDNNGLKTETRKQVEKIVRSLAVKYGWGEN